MGWHDQRTANRARLARLLTIGLCLLALPAGQAQSRPSQVTSAVQLAHQGASLLRDHDAQGARQVLEQAVRLEPGNAEAWSLLATAYSQLGLEQDAIQAYGNTLRLRPDQPLALYNLGTLQLHQGRFEDAVRYLQSFRKQRPQDTSVLLPLAHCFFSLGQNVEAQAAINELLAAAGTDPDVDLKAGELLLAHGEAQAALKPLGDALHLRAGSDEARVMLATAESRTNHPARVIELLGEHDIADSSVYATLLGSALNGEKRFEEAVRLLEGSIRRQGDQKPLYLLLAAAYAGLSKSKNAAEVLEKAHSRWPEDAAIRSALARQQFMVGDPIGALVVLREAPHDTLTAEELGMLVQGYAAIDRPDEARRYGELAAQRQDVPESALIALANVYQLQGRDPDVIALLEKHRARFADSPRYLFTLAFSYYNRGNYSASRDLLSLVIARDSKLPQAAYLMGSCLSSLGKPDEAVHQYEAAVRLDPGNFLYHFQLGMVLSMVGQKERAELELKRSIELNGRHAPARYELAKIYFEASRDELAREELEESIRVDPEFEASYYLLSRVLERLGKHEESAAMLKRFQASQQHRRDQERAAKEVSLGGGRP